MVAPSFELASVDYAPLNSKFGYRKDGSRFSVVKNLKPIPKSFAALHRIILPGYLAYDMERLAEVAAKGTKVIMYETFFHPLLNAKTMREPSPWGAEARSAWLAACARHKALTCHAAPIEITDNTGEPWIDKDHPPAALLAPYIRTLLTSNALEQP